MTFYMWFIIFSEAKGFGYGLVSRAVDSSFKPGGPIVESKPQMKYFTVVALDFPQKPGWPGPPGPHASYDPG